MIDAWKTEVMTVVEVARRLRVSQNTVRQMIADRTVAGVKVGKRWRILTSSVDALLEGASNGDGSTENRGDGEAASRGCATASQVADRRPAGDARKDPSLGGDNRGAGGRDSEATRSVRLRRRAS